MLSGLVAVVAFVPLVIDISNDTYYIVLTIPLLTALLTPGSREKRKVPQAICISRHFSTKLNPKPQVARSNRAEGIKEGRG